MAEIPNRHDIEVDTYSWLLDLPFIDKAAKDAFMVRFRLSISNYLASHQYRLYKYYNPFSSQENYDRFLNHIRRNTMTLCAVSRFNDPFECLPGIDPDTTYPTQEGLLAMRKKLQEVNDGCLRVGCLTESWDNRKMWSFYGGEYRGVCVEYDFSSVFSGDIPSLFPYLLPVIYDKKRPPMPKWLWPESNNGTKKQRKPRMRHDDDPAVKELVRSIFVKDSVWEEEQEWRLAIPLADSDAQQFIIPPYIDYKMPPISKVYLGTQWEQALPGLHKSRTDILHELSDACKENSKHIISKGNPNCITVHETALHSSNYQIEAPELTV